MIIEIIIINIHVNQAIWQITAGPKGAICR